MKKRIHYDPKLTARARELRNNSTLSEVLLWQELKGAKILGYDFHRQKPIDNLIVDFFCYDLMLAIEINGSSHDGKEKYDSFRQQKLESLGIRFLRFDDLDVKQKVGWVLGKIQAWIKSNSSDTPLAPPSRGELKPVKAEGNSINIRNTQSNTHLIKSIATQLGFSFCGISKAEFLSEEAPKLEEWLKRGYQGKMSYLENHFDKRLDPRKLVPGARSVITLVYSYFPKQEITSDDAYKVARYAYGEDYHH
ncbi:MAG: QueG-associated DUF1730 domain-containing protein, partial [Cytophagales bacterium]